MNSAPSNMQRPQTAKALSASQTLLWFSAGVAGMFLIVSAIFAVKYSLQGELPLMSASRAASEPERPGPATVTPPVRNATSTGAAPAAGSSDFESGTEGILPPEAAHLAKVTIADLKGGEPTLNAQLARDFFAGKDVSFRTTALLNAASAIVADGHLVPGDASLADRFKAAYAIAEQTVDSGKATALLDKWIATAQAAKKA